MENYISTTLLTLIITKLNAFIRTFAKERQVWLNLTFDEKKNLHFFSIATMMSVRSMTLSEYQKVVNTGKITSLQ